jgi:hypothetical protein
MYFHIAIAADSSSRTNETHAALNSGVPRVAIICNVGGVNNSVVVLDSLVGDVGAAAAARQEEAMLGMWGDVAHQLCPWVGPVLDCWLLIWQKVSALRCRTHPYGRTGSTGRGHAVSPGVKGCSLSH